MHFVSDMTHSDHRPLGLTLIAIGKLLKVLTLLVAGVTSLAMLNHDGRTAVLHWAEVLRADSNSRYVHRAVAAVSGVSQKRLEELGLASFLYAALFAVEGLGLWFQKRWAEYLTIVITLSFVPFEIYEISHGASAAKVVTLVLNLAAVTYLVVRVYVRRRHGDSHSMQALHS